MNRGHKLVTDGTDNHLVLMDLRPEGLTGSKVEKLCDMVQITLNKNAVAGDTSALAPGGVRIGMPAMTSRGLVEKDFVEVAVFIDRVISMATKIQKESGRKLKDFLLAASKSQEVADCARRSLRSARGTLCLAVCFKVGVVGAKYMLAAQVQHGYPVWGKMKDVAILFFLFLFLLFYKKKAGVG